MSDKKMKKKLTLSIVKKRPLEPLNYIKSKNKTSVVIEKKNLQKKSRSETIE